MGPKTFEESVDLVLSQIRETLIKKHHDYGSKNILEFKDLGVLLRLTDKMARMKNLYGITDGSFQQKTTANESIEDSWIDITGYGLIGLMLNKDIFDRPSANEVGPKVDKIGELEIDTLMDMGAKAAFYRIVAAARKPYKQNPKQCIQDLKKCLDQYDPAFVNKVIELVRYEGEKK